MRMLPPRSIIPPKKRGPKWLFPTLVIATYVLIATGSYQFMKWINGGR